MPANQKNTYIRPILGGYQVGLIVNCGSAICIIENLILFILISFFDEHLHIAEKNLFSLCVMKKIIFANISDALQY